MNETDQIAKQFLEGFLKETSPYQLTLTLQNAMQYITYLYRTKGDRFSNHYPQELFQPVAKSLLAQAQAIKMQNVR